MAAALPRITYNGNNLDFTVPLKENDGFENNTKREFKYSVSGIHQSSYDYNEEIFNIKMHFLTSSEKNNLVTMWTSWACEGKTITFIPDYTNAPGTTYSVIIVSNKFEPKRMAPGLDYWNIEFNARKVIT